MCGKMHYGEFDELVSVDRWSGNRGVSCDTWWNTQWRALLKLWITCSCFLYNVHNVTGNNK